MCSILPKGSNIPEVMNVWVHSKDQEDPFQEHLSPQGTSEKPGKFKDANVLGMDGTLNRFKLLKPEHSKLLEEYLTGEFIQDDLHDDT